MKDFYKWGIIGAGKISEKFAEGLKSSAKAECYAVASRDMAKAEEFASKNGFKKAYGSYEAMLADPEVDIVYIATPNNLHYSNTIAALSAGKNVLCEKPFALNSKELAEMIELARSKKLFLMEALWSRFLPSVVKVKELIESEKLGKAHVVQADFGFISEYNPEGRLFNPSLGGGSLLDIGIYPVFLSLFLFGYPDNISVLSVKAPSGTDNTNGILFSYNDGKVSSLMSSFAVNLDTEARIYCDKGKITLNRMFHCPTSVTISEGNSIQKLPIEFSGNGYNYEADEVMRCLDLGLTESPYWNLNSSIELMKLLDEIRMQFK
ncbi:MAG TPA: Gfo/Idh/MocA family oxidoreductase [Spirochaetota bacterium]|nr:Gfo/Idh/MocA family oxidoreductase [Spirochaetota bacterium]